MVTAHGQDVRNIGSIRGMPLRHAPGGASRGDGRRGLRLPASRARGQGARGARQDRGRGLRRRPRALPLEPRATAAGPAFLCVGSLNARKNVLRLARAFERLGEGTLTFVGDGPLREQLGGRPGIVLAGRVPHDDIPQWIAAADVVCGPSLVEPFGEALLEALACGRPVVATRIGGPPEFVPPGSRDAGRSRPTRTRSPLRSAPPPPCPFRTRPPGPRPRRTTSGCRRLGWRRS